MRLELLIKVLSAWADGGRIASGSQADRNVTTQVSEVKYLTKVETKAKYTRSNPHAETRDTITSA